MRRTAAWAAGQAGAPAHISVVQAVRKYGQGSSYRPLPAEEAVPIPCERPKHVTGITVSTVVSLTVAAAAAERDMEGRVASKVSRSRPSNNNNSADCYREIF